MRAVLVIAVVLMALMSVQGFQTRTGDVVWGSQTNVASAMVDVQDDLTSNEKLADVTDGYAAAAAAAEVDMDEDDDDEFEAQQEAAALAPTELSASEEGAALSPSEMSASASRSQNKEDKLKEKPKEEDKPKKEDKIGRAHV